MLNSAASNNIDSTMTLWPFIKYHSSPLFFVMQHHEKTLRSTHPLCVAQLLNSPYQQSTYFFESHRSSCSQMFFKIGVLKIFENLTKKHVRWSSYMVLATSKMKGGDTFLVKWEYMGYNP